MVIALPGMPEDTSLMAREWEMSFVRRHRVPVSCAVSAATTTIDVGAAPLWVLVIDGAVELRIGQEAVSLAEGDAALVAAGAGHQLIGDAGAEVALGDLRLLSGSARWPNPLIVRSFSARHAALRQLVDTCPLGGACSSPIWKRAYANMFGAAMVTAWLEDDGAAAPVDPAVAAVLAAMAQSPGDAWTLERMARIAHLSRSALAVRFRAALGKAPSDVLRELRMDEARALLTESRHPIGSVAYAVGYGSTAAFSRAFASRYGVAPRAWREARSRARA